MASTKSVTEPLRRVGQFLTFTIMLLIFEALWYKRNYQNKEHYDNHYITRDLKELDEQRKRRGEKVAAMIRQTLNG